MSMKKKLARVIRFGLAAGFSMAVFANGADAGTKMSAKDCRQEWRAHKTMLKSDYKARRSFMKQCRLEWLGGAFLPR